MDRQRVASIETLLYRIQNQLANIERLLNNANRSTDQQLLDDLAERRRQALERHRIEWEMRGSPVSRKCSELAEDEID